MEEVDEKEKKKVQSRKFIVWLVWLLITFCVLIFGMIIKPEVSDTMKALIEKVLDYFQSVSLLYLSANVIQKVGFAVTDVLKEKEDK